MKHKFQIKLLLLLFTAILVSCTKNDSSNTSTSSNGYIQFEENGKNVIFSGIFDANLVTGVRMIIKYDPPTLQTSYLIQGFRGSVNVIQISIIFYNDLKLEIGKTYNLSLSSVPYFSYVSLVNSETNIVRATYQKNDIIKFTASSLTQTEVNGTFSGQLSDGFSSNLTTITNGKIVNVPVTR